MSWGFPGKQKEKHICNTFCYRFKELLALCVLVHWLFLTDAEGDMKKQSPKHSKIRKSTNMTNFKSVFNCEQQCIILTCTQNTANTGISFMPSLISHKRE